MSEEDTSTGIVQLERVSKTNPLTSEDIAKGTLGDYELKPPASKDPTPPASTPPRPPPKKNTLRPDSVGMAVALNSHRPGTRKKETGPKRKKTGGRGEGGQKKQASPTSTSPSSPLQPPRKGGGKEDVDDGKDIIEDHTDVDEEELPDSVPPNSGTTTTGQANTIGTPSVSSSNEEHITECATAWSVVCFFLTTAHMGAYAAGSAEDRAKCFMPLGFADDGRPCEALDEGRLTVVGGSRKPPEDEA